MSFYGRFTAQKSDASSPGKYKNKILEENLQLTADRKKLSIAHQAGHLL